MVKEEMTQNEIKLLRAHANELFKLADRLIQRFQTAGVSTPAKRKKRGLTDEQKAKMLAKKNRNKPDLKQKSFAVV